MFLFCFTSFGVVLLLGGPRARTLEVEIYDQTTRLLHLDVAAVLAVLQLVGVAVALVLYGRYQQRRIGAPAACGPAARWPAGPAPPASGLFVVGVLAVMAAAAGRAAGWCWCGARSPPAAPRPGCLAGPGHQPHRQRACSCRPWTAVVNSLEFALAATVIAVVVGGLAAWAHRPARAGRRATAARCAGSTPP